MSENLIAGLCLWGVVFLIGVLVFDHARHDPKPPAPVRLEDRKTWRRRPGFLARRWGHLVGALGLAAELLFLAPLFHG